MRRFLLIVLFVMLAVGLGIQAVPYGRQHTNPPVVAEPNWDAPQTRALTARACFDCHSNETVWPWYSNVAPISWLVQRDVDEGRRTLNFSEWNRTQKEARESAKTVRGGEMPPWIYTIRSSEARLSPTQKDALARGLAATLGSGRSAMSDREKNYDK
jgi:mono/diheme cytochrome c family protein